MFYHLQCWDLPGSAANDASILEAKYTVVSLEALHRAQEETKLHQRAQLQAMTRSVKAAKLAAEAVAAATVEARQFLRTAKRAKEAFMSMSALSTTGLRGGSSAATIAASRSSTMASRAGLGILLSSPATFCSCHGCTPGPATYRAGSVRLRVGTSTSIRKCDSAFFHGSIRCIAANPRDSFPDDMKADIVEKAQAVFQSISDNELLPVNGAWATMEYI